MRFPLLVVCLLGCPGSEPPALIEVPDAGRDAETELGSEDASPDAPDPDPGTDADGDGLTDREEGLAEGVDSDGDGTPDGLDTDSDDNGRRDGLDAFRDATGALGDLDGDGVLDFRDPDDDGDGIRAVVELDATLGDTDADGDGRPDFRDRDSDGDAILDADEHDELRPDADRDGLRNTRDLDSDDDGLPDAREAGDADLETPPVDTDLDGVPDFLDFDSDDDGLSDDYERAAGVSPVLGDSDADGEGDLLEVALGTDGRDPADGVAVRGWLAVFVDFRQPAEPPELGPVLGFEVESPGGPIGVEVRDVDGAAQFIDRVEVDTISPSCDAAAAEDTNADGFDDTFTAPSAGARLCWRLIVRPNRTVPARYWNPDPACGLGPNVREATLALRGALGAPPATRFFAIISPNCAAPGPADPRCTDCDVETPCRRGGICPCLCWE